MTLEELQEHLLNRIYSLPPNEAIRAFQRFKSKARRTKVQIENKKHRYELAEKYQSLCDDINVAINHYIDKNGNLDDLVKVFRNRYHPEADFVGKSYQIRTDRLYKMHRNHEIWRRMKFSKESPSVLAKEFNLTRQSIHRIYKSMCDEKPSNLYLEQITMYNKRLKDLIKSGKSPW